MNRLEGRTAVVTGSGQGIGRAIALGLAREGASVVIAEINQETGLAAQEEIRQGGQKALAVNVDVSREDSVRSMVERCLAEFGRVDILVNNAGIYLVSSVEEMAEENWDRVIRTNLVGAFLCSRAVVPEFLKQGGGRIINISSSIGFYGARNGAHYAATKAGLIGFTKALALELALHNITVNAICPGLTDTAQPRGHRTEEEMYAKANVIAMRRIGQPGDHVGPAVFLASDAARFVTGQTILVDGGGVTG
ncbi:MAG: 3-oxoacyl-ACP reductase FabG [Deltaproteobacteria bacterium]|nr:3-oxoacyl-ACP reductase FabG [Deltaproteobacteria bacterium]